MEWSMHDDGKLDSATASSCYSIILPDSWSAYLHRLRRGTVRFLGTFFTLPNLLPNRKAWKTAIVLWLMMDQVHVGTNFELAILLFIGSFESRTLNFDFLMLDCRSVSLPHSRPPPWRATNELATGLSLILTYWNRRREFADILS